jgi:hypothetical protein
MTVWRAYVGLILLAIYVKLWVIQLAVEAR